MDTLLDNRTDVTLKTSAKVSKHGGTTGQHNILVKASSDINGRGLNDGVNHHRKRREIVRAGNLGVEEDLGSKETLISDINFDLAAQTLVNNVLLKSLRIVVKAVEFLDNVRTDVAVFLLNLLGSL